MIMKQTKSDIIVFLYIIYSGLPILTSFLNTNANVGITLVVMFYIMLKLGISIFFNKLFAFMPLFLIAILDSFAYMFEGGEYFFRDIYGVLRLLSWPLVAYYIVSTSNKKLAINCLIVTIVVYGITSISTIIGCTLYPSASRLITDTFQDESERYFLKSLNIGDFQFVYTIALAIPTLIYIIKKGSYIKALYVCFLALFIYTIYSSEFTTALMFSAFSLILFLLPQNFSPKRLFSLFLILTIILLNSQTLIISALNWFSEIIGSDTIGSRLADMSVAMTGQSVDAESDYSLRMEVWNLSWQAFVQNPLFGSGIKAGGGHSLILDAIGHFGFVGIFSLVIVFRKIYILYVVPFKNTDAYLYCLFTYFINIAFCLFNTLIMFFVFTFIVELVGFVFTKENRLLSNKSIGYD